MKLCEDAGAAVHLMDRRFAAQCIVGDCSAEVASRMRSSTMNTIVTNAIVTNAIVTNADVIVTNTIEHHEDDRAPRTRT
ncbi:MULTISPECIES: hypothetical protein [Streptomyces]|uniref:hypothetical protein n=1 Tax=Streptomyces TaxID=1883 RepID=UPI0028730E4F|nr:hypothetical protein [Streptomyces sp. CGMCC 4.7035]WNB98128.1 hypothetical protein Q2K21_08590 [Streptomyces sp. CGMCC 4.7035]